MTRIKKFAFLAITLMVGCLVLAMNGAVRAADVQIFDHPPTVNELENTLGRSTAVTRSIVMSPNASSSTIQASAAAPTPEAFGMRIPFGLNSAQIGPAARPYIESVAGLLSKRQNLKLLIEGHTDISGSYSHNMTLSQSRADAVKEVLIRDYGIAADRLSSIGHGPDLPLSSFAPADPRNRRVQFKVQ